MQSTRKPRSKTPARIALAGMTMVASGGFMYAVLTGRTGDEGATDVQAAAVAPTTDDTAAGTAATTPDEAPTATADDSDATSSPTATPTTTTGTTSRVTPRTRHTRTRSS